MQNTNATTTATTTATATKATQLIAASERLTLDPFRDVDWSIEVADDTQYHLINI